MRQTFQRQPGQSQCWCKGKQSLSDVLIGESRCVVSWEREIGEWGLRVETFESIERLFSFGSNGSSDEHLQCFTNVTRKAPRTLFSKSWREPALEGDLDDLRASTPCQRTDFDQTS